MKTLRIGSGAGYSGDRIEPAVELAEHGDLDYLVFECLAERTIALAQQARISDPQGGYDPLLSERMRRVLPFVGVQTGRRRLRVITNMGAANPVSAAAEVRRIAVEAGLDLKVLAVVGDDVLTMLQPEFLLDNGQTVGSLGERLISANAYLGVDGILQALHADADVVITGRVADPSLFLAPQMFEFGWMADDWPRLGRGTLVGHLLECAGQVSGGYFADPGFKDVDDLARLGFPLAEIDADGQAVITKVTGSGGRVSRATCTEQLIYEVHDPAAYLTPDVTADFSRVCFVEEGVDRVRAQGAGGRSRPERLKVSVGYLDGWIGEGQMSYGGPGAVARAQLARDVVLKRLELIGVKMQDVRAELIGMDSLHGPRSTVEPWEVRLRVAARCEERSEAVRVGNEVETLYTNGPSGGGGASKSVRQVVAVASLLLPRDAVNPRIEA
ncbi:MULTISPECIES: acyclic terpene utilization AtuA family protein [unclassified Pseudomonas]|uniref:acyclic terpene utilization AtuA family protein n=1 Tax=unclassified Pseudomonas TaxID=196821 RepID=UPI000C86ADD0|nr:MULTISPECIES: acyclic terpene utilization AtuA family protein [unclassified Pseudomonas]PMV23366.1 ABC transporter substrate-binding protein [Pseudomonas sp. FW305-3-2-15-C-TSA2]PMV31059.1 ABC transporter substrate-binding protein [Pseudomonas sp. DP16D-L5]PMV39652.1 ABC transporter substrate-binding protein [Pseudomonas sp. FW305-3-2-15-A-LB2]PMV45857.1 ABC transporter substrate-binding protein [Pseudomonas sp. FW305-3-2-15-C-R2A1]PMV52302.1 ABC transporter substrate-binding protein [Pseud